MNEGEASSTTNDHKTDGASGTAVSSGAAVTSTPAGTKAQPVRQDEQHGTEASGARGDNPATAGPGPTEVRSNTPENAPGHLNPSAPEDSNVTPGSTSGK
jgi:hypothetical protein